MVGSFLGDLQWRQPCISPLCTSLSKSELCCPHRGWLSVWHVYPFDSTRPLKYGLSRRPSAVKLESLANGEGMAMTLAQGRSNDDDTIVLARRGLLRSVVCEVYCVCRSVDCDGFHLVFLQLTK